MKQHTPDDYKGLIKKGRQEIIKLAKEDVSTNKAVHLWQGGHCTFEECCCLAIQLLVEYNNDLCLRLCTEQSKKITKL